MLSEELIKTLREAEEACVCKFCGRCVLAGPPCCWQASEKRYYDVIRERDWLRKVQSKKDKQINELKAEIAALKALVYNDL